MRLLISILLFFIGVNVFAQPPAENFVKNAVGGVVPPPPCSGTAAITIASIPTNQDYERFGGNERWNENSGCQIASGVPNPKGYYRRFFVSDVVNNDGTYKFNGIFRTKMTDAANAGQLFGFRFATIYPGPDLGGFHTIYTYDGNFSVYPQEWHTAMQAEGSVNNRDFDDGESWIPGYNSTSFLTRYQALWTNAKNWFDTALIRPTSGPHAGGTVPAKNMVNYIDISGVGSYGEWHHCCLGGGYDVIGSNWGYVNADNTGRFPSKNTMRTIIDIHVNTMIDYNMVILIAVLDVGHFGGLNNTRIPAEIAWYAFTRTNNRGYVGWRRDQVGNDEEFYHNYLENNTATYNGMRFDTMVVNRSKYAYVVGEPQGGPANSCPNINMGCSPSQARTLGYYSFGNGNYGGCGGVPTGQGLDSVRTAFRISGPRIKVNSGTMTTSLQQNGTFNITLQWQNIGLATEHRAWTVRYELRNSSNVMVWTGSPNFSVEDFIPAITATPISTNFTLPGSVPNGTYRLVVRVVDPTGYLTYFPLGNTGVETADGAYQLRNNILVGPCT